MSSSNMVNFLQRDRKVFKLEALKGQLFASENSSVLLAATCSSIVCLTQQGNSGPKGQRHRSWPCCLGATTSREGGPHSLYQ